MRYSCYTDKGLKISNTDSIYVDVYKQKDGGNNYHESTCGYGVQEMG